MTSAGVAVAIGLGIVGLGAGVASARDPVAEGRAHLRKANALAGNDRCEAAIKEYSLAYERLHDPVVLFNRAECYRRVGEDASAAADYRAFLRAVPGAPNRVSIEAKIAALDLSSPGSAPPEERKERKERGSPASSSNPAPASGLAAPVTPSLIPPSAPDTPVVVGPAEPEVPVGPPTSAESSASARQGGLWLWAALGVAVAGGAVGAYFVLRTPGASPPSTDLGNYRF